VTEYTKYDMMYREDPAFSRLVDCLTMMLEQCQLAPSDLRAAAMYTAIRHEMRHPKPIYMDMRNIDPEVLALMQIDRSEQGDG
jgi:hypothetical protein